MRKSFINKFKKDNEGTVANAKEVGNFRAEERNERLNNNSKW